MNKNELTIPEEISHQLTVAGVDMNRWTYGAGGVENVGCRLAILGFDNYTAATLTNDYFEDIVRNTKTTAGCISWYRTQILAPAGVITYTNGLSAKIDHSWSQDYSIDNTWKYTNENMFSDPTQRATRPQNTVSSLMEIVEELKRRFKEYTELKDSEVESFKTEKEILSDALYASDCENDELRATISQLKDQIVRMSNPRPTKPSWFKNLF
jgi:hypothetical protein